MSSKHLLVAALFGLGLSTPARADIPPGPPPEPPPPSPNPPPPPPPDLCDVGHAESPGRQCRECSTDSSRPDKCRQDLESGGYRRECRTEGGTRWSEVWCRDRDPSAPSVQSPNPSPGPPPPEPKPGCGACAIGAPATDAALGLALVALAGLAAARRRRPH